MGGSASKGEKGDKGDKGDPATCNSECINNLVAEVNTDDFRRRFATNIMTTNFVNNVAPLLCSENHCPIHSYLAKDGHMAAKLNNWETNDLDAKMNSKLKDLDAEINSKLTDLDAEMNSKLTDLDSEMNSKLKDYSRWDAITHKPINFHWDEDKKWSEYIHEVYSGGACTDWGGNMTRSHDWLKAQTNAKNITEKFKEALDHSQKYGQGDSSQVDCYNDPGVFGNTTMKTSRAESVLATAIHLIWATTCGIQIG